MGSMKDQLGDEPYEPRRRIAYQPTSREAWESMVPISAELDRLIMSTIAATGADGIICQAIETKINRSHQAVSGNLRHLVERDLVEQSGNFGRTTSNRRAIKWRIKNRA